MQLKIFQTLVRFLSAANVPLVAIEHVATRMGVEPGSTLNFPKRTLYQPRPAILESLKVVS